MLLKFIQPVPELQPYIDTMWVFESDFGVPVTDNRVIAPNGKAKIMVMYENPLFTNLDNVITTYKEHEILFIGIWDKPVVIGSNTRTTGTIGIELTPKGAYRFSKLPMYQLANLIFCFADIYGKEGAQLQEQMANTIAVGNKVDLIQQFLTGQLRKQNRSNGIVDYTVDLISSTYGLVEIKELERKTGYTKRYLDILYKEHLGISPKTLSTIIRFQHFYKLWANTDATDFFREAVYELYYDQSHFIKEFKRYTGYTPRQYAQAKNEFGKIFYKK